MRKKKKNNNIILKVLLIISLFLLPVTCFFYSYFLYKNASFKNIFLILFILNIFLLFLIIILLLIKRGVNSRTFVISPDTMIITFVALGFCLIGLGGDILLYGNYSGFRDFVIEKSMNSLHYQGIASFLYPDAIIEKVVNKNMITNIDLSSDIISFEDIEFDTNTFASKEEEELVTNTDNSVYKIMPISGINSGLGSVFTGYMAVVYDPSKVTLAVSPGVGEDRTGTYGQTLIQLAKNNNALVAMNAGGFYDPDWNSNGGVPHGPLIHDGKIITNFRRGIDSGGLVGLTYDDELILGRMSAEEAIANNVRDAVDWGPYLIVNGKNIQSNNPYNWTTCRTAIGQRKDGIILMIVISGHPSVSAGATYRDLAAVFEKYGAYNAAVMDSGASTSMVENGKHLLTTWNGNRSTYRAFPNAWIVTE